MILTALITLLIFFLYTLSDTDLTNFFKIFTLLLKILTNLSYSSLVSALLKTSSNLSISSYPKFLLSSSFSFSDSVACPSLYKTLSFKEFFGINSSLSKSFFPLIFTKHIWFRQWKYIFFKRIENLRDCNWTRT